MVLDFAAAGFASRLGAAILDYGVRFVLLWLLALVSIPFAAGASLDGDDLGWIAAALMTVAIALIFLGYPIFCETVYRGQTVGKKAFGLRVVTVEGAPVRFRHAAVRGFVGLVDFFLPPIAIVGTIMLLVTKRNQRLGDLAAGTIVVRHRRGESDPGAVWFTVPAGYEGYVSSLDVGAVTSPQYEAVRRLLVRSHRLQPHARHALTVRLAAGVRERVGHVPPPGVGPELFLACVAAAYQRRHAAMRPTGAGAPAIGSPPPPPPAVAW